MAAESAFQLYLARAAWTIPVAVLLLGLYQAKVSADLSETLREGERAVAEVLRYERSDRKDVTHAEVDLRVPLADGTEIVRERMALPYSVAHRVERDTLTVRVQPGAAQEVVIAEIGGTQARIAAINAAMCFVGFVIAFIAVFAWNRHLRRSGDPGLRGTPPAQPPTQRA